jgi:S1-C subfamily serine protease
VTLCLSCGLAAVLGTAFLATRPSVITSVDRDEDLAGAVGLVVCGAEVSGKDGTHFEAPLCLGSCFAVSAEGHLLTNRHVVEPVWMAMRDPNVLTARAGKLGLNVKPAVWVFFGKEQCPAQIAHVSDDFDLAVLKVERHHTPFFRLSASDEFHRGKKGVACGFPAAATSLAGGPLSEQEGLPRVIQGPRSGQKIADWFKPRDFEYVRTDGAVSRVIAEEQGRRWVQHTAAVNPGNSGGPLVAEDGTVFGINTRRAVGAEGIFYAQALPQMRREIEGQVPGTAWR